MTKDPAQELVDKYNFERITIDVAELNKLDENLARDAIVEGWENCPRQQALQSDKPRDMCDCDHGRIDGCKAMVAAVAKAIAHARH